MNLSKSDVISVLFQTVIGGIFVGSLSLGSLFIERKKGRVLSITTQRLHLDTNLSCFCGELQRQTRDKNVAIVEFDQGIDAIDQLVCLQDKLQKQHSNHEFKYEKADEDECFRELTRVYQSFQELRAAAIHDLGPREVIDIEQLCDTIVKSHVNRYVKSIVSFTSFFKKQR
jgi:hypothetical protein